MGALASLALAVLALAAPVLADEPRELRWILGPASVDLGDGRVRCALPDGAALVAGPAARSVLDVVSEGADGSELAVVTPTAPTRTWFVIVSWRRVEALPEAAGPVREGPLVWLERPRRDEQTGHVSWTLAGSSRGGPTVNQHVQIPASGGAVEVTLVAPLEELAEARVQLGRIVEGLGVKAPAPNGTRP